MSHRAVSSCTSCELLQLPDYNRVMMVERVGLARIRRHLLLGKLPNCSREEHRETEFKEDSVGWERSKFASTAWVIFCFFLLLCSCIPYRTSHIHALAPLAPSGTRLRGGAGSSSEPMQSRNMRDTYSPITPCTIAFASACIARR
jgi:hypothetical protein